MRAGRRAKYLLLELESGTVLLHLGMSGNLRVVAAQAPRVSHDHFDRRHGEPQQLHRQPGGSTSPHATLRQHGTSFIPRRAWLPYLTDLYFFGLTDGTLNIQPANAPMLNHRPRDQCARRLFDHRGDPRALRRRAELALFTAASIIIVPVTTDNLTKATTGVLGFPLSLNIDPSAA